MCLFSSSLRIFYPFNPVWQPGRYLPKRWTKWYFVFNKNIFSITWKTNVKLIWWIKFLPTMAWKCLHSPPSLSSDAFEKVYRWLFPKFSCSCDGYRWIKNGERRQTLSVMWINWNAVYLMLSVVCHGVRSYWIVWWKVSIVTNLKSVGSKRKIRPQVGYGIISTP